MSLEKQTCRSFDCDAVESLTARWYDIALGAGMFAVRAKSFEEAIIQTEVYAEALRKPLKGKIDVGHALPLVSLATEEHAAYRENAWFESKPSVSLVGLIECYDIPSYEERKLLDPNQPTLFD